MFQRVEQPGIVALMQADRRLVEYIEYAGQPRADLRGEADALALAARQRSGIARQREIVEPDIVEEFQPVADFLEDARGDLVLLRRELLGQGGKPAAGLADRHARHLADMQPVDLHRQRLRFQPEAVASLARVVGLIAPQLLAHPGRIRFLPAPLDIGDDALERLRGLVGAHAIVIDEGDRFAPRAVKDGGLHRLRQLAPGRVHRHFEVLGERVQRLGVVGRTRPGARPGHDGALAQRQRWIGHDERGFEAHFRAEAVAFRTGAKRIVEGEQPRLDLVDGEAGDRAGKALREGDASSAPGRGLSYPSPPPSPSGRGSGRSCCQFPLPWGEG